MSVGEHVDREQPKGISNLSVLSVDPKLDSKSFIDTKLRAFAFPLQEDSSDSDSWSKKLKREVEAKKLIFKSNEKQFLLNAEIQDYSSFVLNTIKKADLLRAQKSMETSLDLILSDKYLSS